MWWWIAAALAYEPVVVVEPSEVPPAPRPSRRDQPWLPWSELRTLTVDGSLTEWADVPVAAPMGPMAEALAAPWLAVRVAWTAPDAAGLPGLAVGVEAVPDDGVVWVVVDPDGLQRRWWQASSRGEAAWCDRLGVPAAEELWLPTRAAACTPATDGSIATAQGAGWEVVGRAPAVTRAARVLVTVRHADGRAATWAPWGRGGLSPELGRRFEGSGGGGVALAARSDGGFDVVVDDTSSAVRWVHTTVVGRPVAEAAGSAAPDEDGVVRVRLPPLARRTQSLGLAWSRADGSEAAVALPVMPQAAAVWVRSVLPGDDAELGYRTPEPTAVEVLLRGRGRRRRVPVTLPAGAGIVRLAWSDGAAVTGASLAGPSRSRGAPVDRRQ